MASTNLIQWNPSATNQETDAEYLADSQRSGGYGTNNIVPSPLLNKATYQVTTFCAAFGQMMAAKGYTTSDASVSVLAAVLANVITEADLLSNLISLAYSPTPAFNAASANGFQMTLTGNITSSTISGVLPGQVVGFFFVQDATGGRTVSWPASFVGAMQPDPAANAVSLILFKADLSGNLRASGPLISNNGVFASNGLVCPTRSPGDNTTNAATTAFVTSAIASLKLFCTRTNKISSYFSGVTYTNSTGAAVFEEVSMIGPQNDNTGRTYQIAAVIDGVAGPWNGITNTSFGVASIGFWVPNGSTFSVTVSQTGGGIVSPPASISGWIEVSF